MDPERQAQAVEVFRRAIEMGVPEERARRLARAVLSGGMVTPSGETQAPTVRLGLTYDPTPAPPQAAPPPEAAQGAAVPPAPGIAGGITRSALQGATFGLSDELRGAAQAVGALVPGGRSPGEAFREGIDAERTALRRFGQEHPILRAGADVAGSILPVLATGGLGLGARGAATAGRLARIGAAEGALIGAVEGAARSEGGAAERLAGGAVGAGLGGAFGGVAGALTPLISRAGAAGVGAVAGGGLGYQAGGPEGAVAGVGGGALAGRVGARAARSVLGRAGPAPAAERAAVAVGRALEREGVTPDQLSRLAAEGVDANILTLSGRSPSASPVQSLARAVHSIPSQGSRELAEFLAREGDDAPRRIREALQRDTRLTFENVQETLDAAAARQRELAAPLYEQAYQRSVPLTDNLADALSNDAFREAYLRGQRIARLEGVDLAPIGTYLPGGGMAGEVRIPVQAIDYMKRGLDDLIESGMRGGGSLGRTEARNLRARLRSVLSEVDELVPEYGAARAVWSGEQAAQDAMQAALEGSRALGLGKFTSETPEKIARALADMTASEREFYRRGALDAIRELLAKRQDTRRDLARILIGRSGGDVVETDLRRRLRLLFETDEDMFRFVREMLDERARAEAAGFITGGSPTSRIDAAREDFVATAGVPTNPRQLVADALASRLREFTTGLTEQTADRVSPLLTMPVRQAAPMLGAGLQDNARRLALRQALLGRLGSANLSALLAPPAAGMMVGGR